MDAALYGPGGYYSDRVSLGGEGGDYYTSAELHPVFGALIGRQAAAIWEAIGRPQAFELVEEGPGSGSMCRDLLVWARHEAPEFSEAIRYVLVETSDPLRGQQRQSLESAGLLDDRVTWEETPAVDLNRKVRGCILANELVDAFPVHLVTVRGNRLLERYVALSEAGRLTFIEDKPSSPDLRQYFDDLGILPAEGTVAEVNLAAREWAAKTARCLDQGALIVLDYGYQAHELYSASRKFGTLLCYRGHSLSSDPLVHVGEQDISSHVDFTTLGSVAEQSGLTRMALLDQTAFLSRLGLWDYIRLLDRRQISNSEREANRRAMLELIEPGGLGAAKVLLLTRGISTDEDFIRARGSDRPPTWLPLLRPGQMRLPGPLEMEGIPDVEAQWRELWSAADKS